MFWRKCFISIVLFWLAGTGTLSAADDHGFHVHDLWVREAPPGFTILSAYLVFENHSDRKVVVTGVTSPNFDRVVLHATVNENGQVSMKELEKIEIEPGQRVEFKPGGGHLMLYDPTTDLRHGDSANFDFHFKDGSKVRVKATVKRLLGDM